MEIIGEKNDVFESFYWNVSWRETYLNYWVLEQKEWLGKMEWELLLQSKWKGYKKLLVGSWSRVGIHKIHAQEFEKALEGSRDLDKKIAYLVGLHMNSSVGKVAFGLV